MSTVIDAGEMLTTSGEEKTYLRMAVLLLWISVYTVPKLWLS